MGGSPSVLIVEDDAGIRALLREVLRLRGYEVAECERGDEAFAAADAARPDVILLDIGLPGLDGLTVLDQLKADQALSRIPVIMVTAWDQTEMVARALQAGAHDYVRKPFELDEMGARVDGAARAKAREDALQAAATVDDGRDTVRVAAPERHLRAVA